MKSWKAEDEGFVSEIKCALTKLGRDHCISFVNEIKWLDLLKDRE